MNKTKLLYSLVAMTLFFMQSQAQQDGTFTLYNYNMNIINPAYAGLGGRLPQILKVSG